MRSSLMPLQQAAAPYCTYATIILFCWYVFNVFYTIGLFLALPLLVIAQTPAGGNSKKETGTDKITANSRSSSGKGQMLFERCSSCCCYCVKSEFFCPRWLNEKLFATPLRASNVCDDWSFSFTKECALALQPNEGCRLRLVSRRLLWLIFARAGRFGSFTRWKNV